jgi:hypothetical protein
MPPHLLSSRNAPPSRSDFLLKELLQQMTKQPTPNKMKPWGLSYIPPKHLRLPGFEYGLVEETDEGELLAQGGRRKLLERQFKEMAKSLSSKSLSSLSIADDEDQILLDVSREGV